MELVVGGVKNDLSCQVVGAFVGLKIGCCYIVVEEVTVGSGAVVLEVLWACG